MIELGKMQTLTIAKKSSEGFILRSDTAQEVMLPKSQGIVNPNDTVIEVFVYKDSQGRLTATTQQPKLTLDEVASLRVKEVTKIGAFMDWGLPKDLFLPFREQTVRVREGKEYLVGLYIDQEERLCATMRIYDFLRTDSPYRIDDWVTGIVYDVENDLGALVAADQKYSALIPKTELISKLRPGDQVEVRVVRVREDGKLDLSLRDRLVRQLDIDAQRIVAALEKGRGFLNLGDHSSPQAIRDQLGMSKGSFKKALGRLLKGGTISLSNEGIHLEKNN
jgi:hypothetical protein